VNVDEEGNIDLEWVLGTEFRGMGNEIRPESAVPHLEASPCVFAFYYLVSDEF